MPKVGKLKCIPKFTKDGFVRVDWMTKAEREMTPPEFNQWLVNLVRGNSGSSVVACLWIRQDSHYLQMTGVDLWDEGRDATKYAGPYPVVCHPPCGPWGKFKWSCYKQPKEHGLLAIEFVHKYGGVIEQPLGSTLFRDHGRQGSLVVRVDQSDFGHRGKKPTLVYIVKSP